MGYWRKLGALVGKDIAVEFKTKEMLSSMFIFSFLVIVIFAFAFTPSRATTREVFPGILWIGFAFAGVLGLNRSFAGEKDNDCLLGLMLTPVDRTAIFLAKAASNLLFLVAVEAVSLPLFFVLFDYRLEGPLWLLLAVILLGTIGFIVIGTFLAALAANTRASEILLPLILFPVIMPVVIGAVKCTAIVLAGVPPELKGELVRWVQLLGVYNIIFLTVPLMLFDYVLEV
ncbi:MAG: heme exporter protein CcmB [Bacillota bacterium]